MVAGKRGGRSAHTVLSVWQIRPAPLILLSGKEGAIADLAQQTVRRGMRSQHPELEIHDIDAKLAAAGELMTLASPSLFGEARLIRIANLNAPSAAFMADLEAVIPLLDEATTLLLRHSGGNGGKAALALIRSQANAIEVVCDVLKDSERSRFVTDFLASRSQRIEPEALRSLITAYAEDLAELIAIAEQLSRDASGTISLRQVDQLTAGRVETNSMKIADAAASGNGALALTLLRHGLHTGQEPIAICSLLTNKLRLMAKVYGLGDSDAELAKRLKQHPYSVKLARRDARNWREGDLAKMLDYAAETEWQLKGGARNKEFVIERFVLAVAKRGRI